MRELVREIHRRSLWQVLGIYLAASWLVLQVVQVVTETAGLPDWTPGMAFVLLLIGLPICLGTAFVQEGIGGKGAAGDAGPGESSSSAPEPAKAPTEEVDDDSSGEQRDIGSLHPAFQFATPRSIPELLTWRNAIMGGVAAFAFLGFVVTAYVVMWTTGIGPTGSLVAQGVFEEGETVVLADFDDPSGSGLGDVTTDAIRVDLQESSVINLAAPAYVNRVLARMGRNTDEPFTAAAARELAQREGLKAIIQGEVGVVGSGYLLTASLVAAETGDVLRAFRVPIGSEDELLAGIDKLSQDIREKSGESLRDIRSGRALAEVTTSSLEALRLLSEAQGLRLSGQQIESIPLLERALELDPDFAMAWRALSVIMWNTGTDGDRMVEASTRAFELRERLTDREAMLADAWYRFAVERDPEAAISAYRRLLERYPEDEAGLNNLGVHGMQLGRWQEALGPLETAASLPTPTDNSINNLGFVLWSVGQREAAWASLQRAEQLYPEGLALRNRHWLLNGERRFEEAIEAARIELATLLGEVSTQVQTRADMAGYYLGLGRYSEALDVLSDAQRIATERGNIDLHQGSSAIMRVWAAWVLEGPSAARSALDLVLTPDQHEGLTLTNAQSFILSAMVMGGRGAEARTVFDRWEAAIPTERRGMVHRQVATLLDAWEARIAGDLEEAGRHFDIHFSEVITCGDYCYLWAERARIADELGDADRAIEFYENHVQSRTPLFWTAYMAPWDPVAYERLAALYAERGEIELARARLETLVATFENGDGPYIPYVERARARLAELRSDDR